MRFNFPQILARVFARGRCGGPRERSAHSVAVDNVLDRLSKYHCDVDKLAESIQSNLPKLKCQRGCAGCCIDDLRVLPVEAALIARTKLSPPVLTSAQAPPKEPALSDFFVRGDRGRCAFLNQDDACSIYAVRPLVCRVHGLPLRWREDDPPAEELLAEAGINPETLKLNGWEYRDICELNENLVEIETLPPAGCWDTDSHDRQLERFQVEFDEARQQAQDEIFGHQDDVGTTTSVLDELASTDGEIPLSELYHFLVHRDGIDHQGR
ncbi:hypothetical protein CYMTET_42631 [Cymbomonas tetramitiformis]|uniref:YkgJ family cysteine cluster protein n=1 Tax=Cymbomonas tetramitiformis TaxID=36881 RepID=A0AAE0F1B6_9CHLO|nr:hypothetical protein CYMTET_42631 [Cymbomonas tetramitiformis]